MLTLDSDFANIQAYPPHGQLNCATLADLRVLIRSRPAAQLLSTKSVSTARWGSPDTLLRCLDSLPTFEWPKDHSEILGDGRNHYRYERH